MINSNTEIQKDTESPAKKKHNAKVEVDGELCKECLLCIEACAPDVLKVADALNKMGYHPVEYIGEGCNGCGVCFYVCPEPGTIKVYKKIKAA
jgi:NAD-dependent dihydropyrimidine dehydrogenase PreA subunit